MGSAKALELIVRAARLSAGEALALGLVNRVSPAGVSVVADTLSWLEPVATGAPAVGALGKGDDGDDGDGGE